MRARHGRVIDAAAAYASMIAVPVPVAVVVAMTMPAVIVTAPVAVRTTRFMPLASAVMSIFPLAPFPVPVAVVIALAVPARTHYDHWRRGCVDRRRRRIDRLRRIGHARNADVDPDIDVRQRDRRCTDPQTCNDRHGQPAVS